MQPNSDNQRNLAVPQRSQPVQPRHNDKELAEALMKEQIDRLYDDQSQSPRTTTNTGSSQNPYTQSQHTQTPHANASWEKYHTAWQQYYQQYYQRYYMAEQQRQQQTQQQPQPTMFAPTPKKQEVTPDEAINEIRNDLLSKVKRHSASIRKNRHFVPIASAVLVMALFMFLQYNRVMVGQVRAYVSPGSISAENVLLDTTANAPVSDEPRMIIPKINVDAPTVYGLDSVAEGPVQEALKDGIVHYPIPGASSVPGQKGNSVFLGHSSNDVFDDGDYKFVFVQLEKLQEGDTFHINYEGTRYTYSITETETILPTQVDKLIRPSENPTVTLITCTPIGTAEKRFLVHAEQISPNPSEAAAPAPQDTNPEPQAITGNSPTLFERLFGS